MIVGEDQTVGAHDNARAQGLLHALAHLRRGAEELREERIVEERIDLHLGHRAGIDIHHRGRDALDHRRERQLNLAHRRGLRFSARRGGRQAQGLRRHQMRGRRRRTGTGHGQKRQRRDCGHPGRGKGYRLHQAQPSGTDFPIQFPPHNRGISKPSQSTKRAAFLPPPEYFSERRIQASVSSETSTGPESLPLASTSRSTNSMIAIGALSPWRKPALSTRV
jgi:hypothetical protein